MKAKNFRKLKSPAFTRKKFIRRIPDSRIRKFTMGTIDAYEYELSLIAQSPLQIQHNALESARIAANRYLELKLGTKYLLRIVVYPHHILRENKLIFGAHADRLQTGMREAFGKSVGRAARVRPEQAVILVQVNEDGIEIAKEALRRGKAKLPKKYKILVKRL